MFMKGCIFLQKDILKNSVKGLLVGLGVSAVLLTIFGYICYTREDPSSLFKPLGIAALFLGSFAGGFMAARFNKTNGLAAGALTGLFMMLFVILISLFLRPENKSIGLINWLLYVGVAIIGAVGGRFGVPASKRRKKRARRR